jgi:predicted phage terminase large subunit-like protein
MCGRRWGRISSLTLGLDNEANAHILDIYRVRGGDTRVTLGAIKALYDRWHPFAIEVEQLSKHQGLVEEAQRRWVIPIRTFSPQGKGDKVARAQLTAIRAQTGKLYADKSAAWWPALAEELMSFPGGATDDIVDALSGAMHMLASSPAQERRYGKYHVRHRVTTDVTDRRRHFFPEEEGMVLSG